VYEEAGEVRGSASYRTKHRFDDAGITDGELMIGDLHGLDAAALRALWRLLLDVDLVRTVRAWNQPEDCELAWWLADPRQLRVSPRDGLWLRILDVPAALARRRYASEGHLVLGVRDSQVDANCGAFELEAGGEGAECKRSSAEPEVALDVRDLASLYLGGVSVQSLARAGRVAGDGAALQRMDRMFRWHLAPWCADSF
jgi:predicted acetyltransferase